MKKLVTSLFLILLAIPTFAAVKPCVLGGPTAMDTNRQLAEGEVFVKTDRPLVVNLRFKPTTEHPEQVGECMLSTGEEVAVKNGILQWVRKCGNDEVNRNIFVIPLELTRGEKGERGEIGPMGPQGPKGDPAPVVRRSRCGIGCKIVIGVLVGGGLYAATQNGGGSSQGNGNTL